MKHIKLLAWPLSLGVVALAIVSLVNSDSGDSSPRLTTVKMRTFDITVDAIGVLDAASSHMLSSTIPGDRGKIIYLIADGTQVKKGDVLVKLDPAPFKEDVRRLESEVGGLEAAVDANRQMLAWEESQVEREIRNAEYNLEVAELEFIRLRDGEGPLKLAGLKTEITRIEEDRKRYGDYIADLEALVAEGFDHPREIAAAREKCAELAKKYRTAEKNYLCYERQVLPSLIKAGQAKVNQAEMELGQLKKGGVFRIAKARAAYDEVCGKLRTAINALEKARHQLADTVIHAPSAGIAIHFEAYRDGVKRKPREGDRVIQNQPILYLPDIASMIVKTQVREIDLHKILAGQTCRVRVDAYPEVVFDGKISFVGALAAENARLGRGEKYFDLTVTLTAQDERLRPGMTARVNVISERVADEVAVPVQAVFKEKGLDICYKAEGKAFRRVAVSTGRQNEELVVINAGLEPGDQISLVRPDRVD